MTPTAAFLLLALVLAHQLGDFTPLATPRMLEAKSRGRPLGPILSHAVVHGVLIGLAVLAVARPPGGALAVAFAAAVSTHFLIDLGKARLGRRYPTLNDAGANPFWWALGFDQFLHLLVLIGIAFFVLG